MGTKVLSIAKDVPPHPRAVHGLKKNELTYNRQERRRVRRPGRG